MRVSNGQAWKPGEETLDKPNRFRISLSWPACLGALMVTLATAPATLRAETTMNNTPVRYLPDVKLWILNHRADLLRGRLERT